MATHMTKMNNNRMLKIDQVDEDDFFEETVRRGRSRSIKTWYVTDIDDDDNDR